ncbi:MAG: hypothetical protein IJW57_12150 [Spirochaetaceae bacterium]|nr:hypothetical protein [Spirochaetaceae bacterium]MBQ8561112.1 hypothetical protein [Spirochaetaceae bacterium]
MQMTIPIHLSLEDIDAIRYVVRKSRTVEPSEDMRVPVEILSRILETAYLEVNSQQNTLEVFAQALEPHMEAVHG